MSSDAVDRRLMRFAIALGERNNGLTWPNPAVGAVVVDAHGSSGVLAVGRTDWGGRPHAERLALAEAGEAARGATLYVSLEPCSHHGRTPPCADAIVAAGIARVVTAMQDPDGRVAGRGHAILRAAGLEVRADVEMARAAQAHRGHVSRVTRGRPWVTCKLARTLDGFAGRLGSRLMITGEGANARTHLLRAHADAILTGLSTVTADDPRLDVRLPGLDDRMPVRAVLDSQLRLPASAGLVGTADARPTWVLCSASAPAEAEDRLARCGVAIERVPAGVDGRVDLAAALARLGERGITRLLCEGGPTLADGLAAAGLLDEVVLITGAVSLGSGVDGVVACGPALARALETRFRPVAREAVGPDLIETFERI